MSQPSAFVQLLPLIAIFAVFYLILMRPMQKKQKQHAVFLQNLKRGDRVISSGGLYGTIQAVDDKTVVLKVSDQVKVKVSKSAISAFQPEQGGE